LDWRPDLVIGDLRGNVDTRLRKLDAGDYDAIVLASAGLRRLGLAARISVRLPVERFVPAVGQGALAIEARADDAPTAALLAALEDPPTRACVTAERAFLAALGGDCTTPLGAIATCAGNRLEIIAMLAGNTGEAMLRLSATGSAAEAAGLGVALAARIREAGSAPGRSPGRADG
jgi:hydroxymethylbilane synthase